MSVQVVATVLLDSRLLRLSEDEAESEDVVRGALEAVLEGAPAALVQKFIETAYAEGMCSVSVLELLDVQQLLLMGFRRGEAMRLCAKLFPRSGHVAAVERVLSDSPVSGGRSNECAPEFPELSGGLPSARDLKAWMPGVLDVLERRGVDVSVLAGMQCDPAVTWIRAGITAALLTGRYGRC